MIYEIFKVFQIFTNLSNFLASILKISNFKITYDILLDIKAKEKALVAAIEIATQVAATLNGLLASQQR